jgi:serine/threonine-protein kinase
MPTLAGQTLDKYDMLEEVGHGGMAVVYRSRDRVLDREVAVKVLHPHLADREESRARLQREAITVAKLRHENILEIFDYSGTDALESYIVTEFIHGVTLRDWLDNRWRPRPALAAMIVHRLCLALAHAHEFGVVHRDIKPENVMIREDGCLKLMDFGIAQILDHQRLTMTGQLLGSPAYMAPELISGKPIDARTDLFSVGVLLYQLATGQLPFAGRNPHEVLNRIADADYAPASSINPMVDEDLEDILKRALARDPEYRYQTARALASDLEDYLGSLGLEPAPEEIRLYFKNAEDYVEELDRKICAHLLEKAEKANKDGHSARALKLLARVIELDPENRRARDLIDVVRRRGRVMRQVLVGVSALALVGLVGAGVLLMQRLPPDARPQESAPDLESPAKTSVVVPVADAPPRVADADPGDPPHASDPPPERLPARVRPAGHECRVEIDGLPVAQIGNHALQVGDDRPVKLADQAGVGLATITIPAKGGTIRLVGSERYRGTWSVKATDCPQGKMRQTARPRAARIEFRGLPPELEKPGTLLVTCLSGCESKAQVFAENLAATPIPIPDGEHRVQVELLFVAVGYQDRKVRKELLPGPNAVSPGLVLK